MIAAMQHVASWDRCRTALSQNATLYFAALAKELAVSEQKSRLYSLSLNGTTIACFLFRQIQV
jgi:hypothetical protein